MRTVNKTSRRPHKKSRHGCDQCKRRHMRCDGNRSVCVNCDMAEIRCSFLSKNELQIVQVVPPRQSHQQLLPQINPTAPVPAYNNFRYREASVDPYDVNINHFILFNNLSSKDYLALEATQTADFIPSTTYMEYAATTPYLMHQLLAGSALHLSITSGNLRQHFQNYATGLRSRALLNFKTTHPSMELTLDNCVQIYLFSSMIAVHLLCDSLHFHRDSLEDFLNSFTQCINIYRGVTLVLYQAEHLLEETQLGYRLEATRSAIKPSDSWHYELVDLWEFHHTSNPSSNPQDPCYDAIFQLQRIFKAQNTNSQSKRQSPNLLFAWPALISLQYVDLLCSGQAEALVILAHYAVLLHRARHLWPFGDSGRFLIQSITAKLGSSGQKWMRVPLAALQEEDINGT